MNWGKKIKAILGFFWVHVWKDSWIIDLIISSFKGLIGMNLLSRLRTIVQQVQCKSLYHPQSIRYVKILVDSDVSSGTILLSDMVIGGSSQIGGATSNKAYRTLQAFDVPDCFQITVNKTDVKLIKQQDYKCYPDRGTIEFIKPLSDYGFETSIEDVQGEPVSCYVLWGVYNEYRTLRDNFTGLMEIPDEWLYKYPGAVEAAWSIKQNGANQRDVKRLLGAIGGCPFSTASGNVYLDGMTAYIMDTCYKGTGQALVKDGNKVTEDIKLFTGPDTATAIDKFPAVYTYKTGLPQGLPGLHVLTEVGILYAPNDSDSVSGSILPLLESPSGSVSSAYRNLCNNRNSDSTIPYAEIPSIVNPAEFIFTKVWGPSATIIVTPPSNQKDMKKAVEFIVKNTALGTLITAYKYESDSYSLLYPDKTVQQEAMLYYNESINNGTSYKERLGDFAE